MNDLFDPARATRPAPPAAEPLDAAVPDEADGADPELLACLKQAMTHQHAHHQEGLTLGALAGKLGASEAALRGLINQGGWATGTSTISCITTGGKRPPPAW